MDKKIFEIIKQVSQKGETDTNIVRLGQLVDTLADVDPDKIIEEGFAEPDSWRGIYRYVAFSPARNVTVSSMLKHAKSAIGATFEGYKGDTFTMSRETPCYIACYGFSGDNDGITSERLQRMLGIQEIKEHKPSTLPKRPFVLNVSTSYDGQHVTMIPTETWDEFEEYVSQIEAIATRLSEG